MLADSNSKYDVIIIGAGAAGLMCAKVAGKRGLKVLVLDHAGKPAEKIRISGGGRCNFTNVNTTPANFLSQNPRFCISALKRYTPHDFIKLVEKHKIAYHEKTLGQLFCDGSSQNIINMLLDECAAGKVEIRLQTNVTDIVKNLSGFTVTASDQNFECTNLVVATGGLSIPKMGATDFGYQIARKFRLKLIPPRAGLVPFTLNTEDLKIWSTLSGISLDAIASYKKVNFQEGMLFTHRGLSGPAILQISSYWQEGGDAVYINLLPGINLLEKLKNKKVSHPKLEIGNVLAEILPKRLTQIICDITHTTGQLANFSSAKLESLANFISKLQISPSGTEGYRTAEVTLGGVDTDELSSSNFESKSVKGLYFIGEVVDVTGHLGGYNFQWAWASGHAAGLSVAAT
jgi:predicted Rossmann fold flavoprotein